MKTTAEQRALMKIQVLKGWSIWSTQADVMPLLEDLEEALAKIDSLESQLKQADDFLDGLKGSMDIAK